MYKLIFKITNNLTFMYNIKYIIIILKTFYSKKNKFYFIQLCRYMFIFS